MSIILQRKQTLKSGLIDFIKTTVNDDNIYSVGSDINKGYWVYKGVLFDNTIFNIKSATKLKTTSLNKDTVYYISTITGERIKLFNL